jgi:predicted ester cyclase
VIDVVTYKDGKVIEHWVVADTLSLMQQLGAVPQ